MWLKIKPTRKQERGRGGFRLRQPISFVRLTNMKHSVARVDRKNPLNKQLGFDSTEIC